MRFSSLATGQAKAAAVASLAVGLLLGTALGLVRRDAAAEESGPKVHPKLFAETGGMVNIIAVGAKGDGRSDDWGPIQDALTSMQTTGGKLYVPTGTYLISGKRLVYRSVKPISIVGDGWGSRLIWSPPDDAPERDKGMLNICGTGDAEGFHTESVLLQELFFDFGGSRESGHKENRRGINIYNADNIQVFHNHFKGAKGEMLGLGNFGLPTTPGRRATVMYNVFFDFAQDGVNPNVFDANVSYNVFEKGSAPIEAGRDSFTAIGNVFKDMTSCLNISCVNQFIVSQNRFENCAQTNQGYLVGCIHLGNNNGPGAPASQNGQITQNVIVNSGPAHPNMAGLSSGSMADDKTGMANILVSGNVIRNTWRGIRLDSLERSLVTENLISDQNVGIELGDTRHNVENRYVGNVIRGSKKTDIENLSSPARKNVVREESYP